MRTYRRVAAAIARHGLRGATRRVAQRLRQPRATSSGPVNGHARDTDRRRRFLDEVAARGLRDVDAFYWYHTVDLGAGLVTPGTYDYRSSIDAFALPASMRGLRALDVGAGTGFFSFEMERRGAHVTALEVPSFDAWDRFPGESVDDTVAKIGRHMPSHAGLDAGALDQLQRRSADVLFRDLLDGPFLFCRDVLGSKVERLYAAVYDLAPSTHGEFDVVMLGDVLVHTIDPLRALAAVASVCRDTLVISTDLPNGAAARLDLPAMIYVGGPTKGLDDVSWWRPNLPCLEQVLGKLGFRSVVVAGVHAGTIHPGGGRYSRTVLHARR